MESRLVPLHLVVAMLASTSALAGQPHGRDSVYAAPEGSFPSAKATRAATGSGRGSVYASDLPAPTPRTDVGEVTPRFGRT
jgi:hypothetical protein